MPAISEISYSRDAAVAAVRDYYRFLVTMYLDKSNVLEPPEGGWPSIDSWENFDKTDEVIALLRHLPYIRQTTDDKQAYGAPECEFADWQATLPDTDGQDLKEWSEPDPDDAEIPPHIVGLTVHRQNGPTFLLDTELGVVYWPECIGEIKGDSQQVEDDPYDWVDEGLIPENQVEWRAGSGIWAIRDFFEMLKLNFKKLNFVPISPRVVKDVRVARDPDREEMVAAVQEVYRKHGWPNVARYRKEDCLAEIKSVLEARFPDVVR